MSDQGFGWTLAAIGWIGFVLLAFLVTPASDVHALCEDLYATVDTRADSLEIYLKHDYCPRPSDHGGEHG